MLMLTEQKLYTADDLWALQQQPEHQRKRYELSEGRLIEMSPASYKHGKFGNRLNSRMALYADEHGLGTVSMAETGFILDYGFRDRPSIVRAPDIAFVRAEREAGLIVGDGFFPGAPDLAVEVMSPNDLESEIEAKIYQYLAYGTRQVWVLYPKDQTIHMRALSDHRVLGMDDTLDGGDVLPGFRIPVRDIFAP
jgi:Uma2 family endonuclease